MPKVAVIIRSKDRLLLLRRAINSVLEQTEQDWKIVLVNDGGDRSALEALLETFPGSLKLRLHVVHNETSLGMEPASNKAIRESASEFLVVHDDDDAWHPQFLEKTLAHQHLSYPNVGGVVTGVERVWERVEGSTITEESREDVSHWQKGLTFYEMCGDNLFPPISFLYKRECYEKAGPYREDIPILADWMFNIHFMRHYDVARVPEILAYYHHRVGSGDEYTNTMDYKAREYRDGNAYLRNEYLRKDLDAGEIGIGFLMNVATATRDLQNSANSTREMVLDMHQLKNRVGSRLKKLHLLPRDEPKA